MSHFHLSIYVENINFVSLNDKWCGFLFAKLMHTSIYLTSRGYLLNKIEQL